MTTVISPLLVKGDTGPAAELTHLLQLLLNFFRPLQRLGALLGDLGDVPGRELLPAQLQPQPVSLVPLQLRRGSGRLTGGDQHRGEVSIEEGS